MGDPVGPQWEILSDHSGFSEVIRNMFGPSPCQTAVDSNCIIHFLRFYIGQENETKPNKKITAKQKKAYLGQVNKTEQDTLQRNRRRHTKDK